MQYLASFFILVCAGVGLARPTSMLKLLPVPGVQLAQVPMGQRCVTPTRSCDTPRRPINTQCYCGSERGVVR